MCAHAGAVRVCVHVHVRMCMCMCVCVLVSVCCAIIVVEIVIILSGTFMYPRYKTNGFKHYKQVVNGVEHNSTNLKVNIGSYGFESRWFYPLGF